MEPVIVTISQDPDGKFRGTRSFKRGTRSVVAGTIKDIERIAQERWGSVEFQGLTGPSDK